MREFQLSFKLLILFLLISCGVKSPPIAPKSSSIPSIEEQNPDLGLNPGDIEMKKK